MAVTEVKRPGSEGRVWGFLKHPFRQIGAQSNGSSSHSHSHSHSQNQNQQIDFGMNRYSRGGGGGERRGGDLRERNGSVSSVAKSILPVRRRLRLDPASKLYFPCMESLVLGLCCALIGSTFFSFPRFSKDEPGKQVRSAVKIKNTSKSHVAFKFQTTAPKSCFMRPPGAILAPGESIIATVFKFVEHPENNEKSKVKFKIMSLKVKGPMEYVPELFDEQKDQIAVEQILRVVFLDVEHPTPALEKLNRMLAEAEAELESRKKPPEDSGPKFIGEGLVIDEWKERRERFLARQEVEGIEST
ncbi:Vesicle-associated protein 4-2-like protein [Drosera capensis]